MKKALIIVDVQNDFCPGGSLAVKDGDKIIENINQLIKSGKYDLIVATKDFHPKDHKSFASNNFDANNNKRQIGSVIDLNGIQQVMWPDHCVENTKGADFHKDLNISKINKVFYKGTNKEIDSYSGFLDNDKKTSTGLESYLKENAVTNIDVVGLALDYCVKATAIDSARLGFKTNVILNSTKAVNLTKGDDLKSIQEMKQVGIKIS